MFRHGFMCVYGYGRIGGTDAKPRIGLDEIDIQNTLRRLHGRLQSLNVGRQWVHVWCLLPWGLFDSACHAVRSSNGWHMWMCDGCMMVIYLKASAWASICLSE